MRRRGTPRPEALPAPWHAGSDQGAKACAVATSTTAITAGGTTAPKAVRLRAGAPQEHGSLPGRRDRAAGAGGAGGTRLSDLKPGRQRVTASHPRHQGQPVQ